MKKEKIDYFEYFYSIAQIAEKQSALLKEIINNYDNKKLPENIKLMHSFEHNADILKNGMVEELIKDFLPPIDREDIMALADLFDSVCDSIDDILLKFYMYDVKTIRDDTYVIVDNIAAITSTLKELAVALKSIKDTDKLMEKVIAVNDIEDYGDMLYLDAMHAMFSSKSPAKEMIVWDSIYAGLEDCFDSCEKTADEIRNVIIKNS